MPRSGHLSRRQAAPAIYHAEAGVGVSLPPRMNSELKYGLLAGSALCLWIYAEFLLGWPTSHSEIGAYSGYFSNLIPLTALWLLLRKKQAEFGPLFNLWRGVLAGLLMAFVASLVVYVFLVFYHLFINPDSIEQALKLRVDQLRANHVPETEIRAQIVQYRSDHGPLGMLLSVILSSTLLGGVLACFISLWLIWRAEKAR
jgi:Protein of unknown function (DUF4199)